MRHRPQPHEGLVTVDALGSAVLHDTLSDALQWVSDHPDQHIYWCNRTPLTPSMMAYLCLT